APFRRPQPAATRGPERHFVRCDGADCTKWHSLTSPTDLPSPGSARIMTTEGAHAPSWRFTFPPTPYKSQPMSMPRPTEPAAQTPSAAGHEANGRFARGNPRGPGNPFARQVAKLRKVIR